MKKSKLSVFILFILFSTFAFAKVPTSNFKIIDYHTEWRRGKFYIHGEIKNIGNVPGGPKIQVIVRSKDGKMVDEHIYWPFGTNNLKPGKSTSIKFPLTRDKRAHSVEIDIISVSSWDD